MTEITPTPFLRERLLYGGAQGFFQSAANGDATIKFDAIRILTCPEGTRFEFEFETAALVSFTLEQKLLKEKVGEFTLALAGWLPVLSRGAV